MNNSIGGLSRSLGGIGFWFTCTLLVGLGLYSIYGSFNENDAVASENSDIAGTDSDIGSKQTGVSIESILSDSDTTCLFSMNASARAGIKLSESSTVEANGCAVHSNSRNQNAVAINIERDASMNATYIYSRGKLLSKSENTIELTDHENSSDPLGSVNAPEAIGCDYTNHALTVGKNLLKPGVYCGGLIALGDSKIDLEPGIYVMKNGPLVLGGKATLIGEHAGFYFTGSNAVLNLGVSAKIALTAPVDGPLAGILFFEDRNSAPNNEFIVRSGNARLLEGAIYLPKGKFVMSGAAQVGGEANWTALIANKIELRDSARLVLNSDFASSKVPVPEGIWPGGPVASVSNSSIE